MGKRRYRIKQGIKYIAYRTFNSYAEGRLQVEELRLAGVEAIVYNNYNKRNFIVFVKEVIDGW